MLDPLSILPFSFWVVVALLAGGTMWAVGQIRSGLGMPVIAVLVTVAAWYVGDVFYNDYAKNHALLFSPQVLENAWWQVALFLVVFLFLAPEMHAWINERGLHRQSQILQMVKKGPVQVQFQAGLRRLLVGCVTIWALLSIVAVFRLQDEILYYFCPYLSYRADPWSRGRIGSGMDFAWSFAGYLQLYVAVMFGILAALLQDRRFCSAAVFGVLITWPYFLFDRTRNTMLAAVLPAILALVFLRLRISMVQKILLLAGFFLIINAWFSFVIAHRSNTTIASAFAGQGFSLEKDSTAHHEGLNMFQELCWINTFIDNGAYQPNWGKRYFAEIVNPIPRSIWPGKPMIGIDYAILRGQSFDEGGAGVGATISTGMIGQGVINFGQVLGPMFAAFLMTLWVAVLARLDLYGQGMGRIPLYGLGLILTFNLGRDITLITLYTFVFGALFVWLLNNVALGKAAPPKPGAPPSRGKAPVPSGTSSGSAPTPVSSSARSD
jgi:hypothetical protein